ncbi:hypothetical protein [Chamaesiphon minutus]|uniref:Spore coat protein U domain-containing protein n=1 Tax=Chamaesiphon minutus (strain ATCC 27169 / PCC 6605) TaxID=1173020 RepID=K9UBU6_CHAP6|nr:hypothetical protein [Chamaesiphon minutus]AFY91901.1 hypothetical protein Cha6605_0624 [Chamaesiphon minutus PCC 6605]
MYRSQFIQFVAVASWLWMSQENIARSEQFGLIAQNGNDNTCQIDRFIAEELLPNSNPATGLRGLASIAVSCRGNASGNLLLTLNPSVVYNGGAKMQFVSQSGVLAGATTNPATSTISVPISSQGIQSGNGSIRVAIVAPSGKLLKAARDYKLVLTAVFN